MVHGVGTMGRSAGRSGGLGQILAAMAILESMWAVAGAQIDVNETGLHDDVSVSGVDVLMAEPPYLNEENISVQAWGETDPSLYANVAFSAYGLSSEPNLINTGSIGVNATGGNAATDAGSARAYVWDALGIFAFGDANNAGDITITATGGTAADSSSSGANANIQFPGGIYAWAGVHNTGNITITATAGTADSSDGSAYADIWDALGIYAGEDLYNAGDITIAVTGGTANAANDAFAYSNATGFFTEKDVTNTGTLRIMAAGGSAGSDGDFATASTAAYTYGISAQGSVNNSGNILAIATGGTADANDTADADGAAFGIRAFGAVNNRGDLTIIAIGGTAGADDFADAHSYAEGIATGEDVNNTGAISVTAVGGIAAAADAQADAEAYGIATDGDVNNSGAVTVTGAAQEGFDSHAYGIFMNSGGRLTNTGIIRAAADTAYEVYVASGTTTLVDIYNVALDGDPNRGSFGVADGATLALNDATLTVTAVRARPFGARNTSSSKPRAPAPWTAISPTRRPPIPIPPSLTMTKVPPAAQMTRSRWPTPPSPRRLWLR